MRKDKTSDGGAERPANGQPAPGAEPSSAPRSVPPSISPSRFPARDGGGRAGAQLEKLYYRIGEVASIVGVEPHVLRYWETEFRSVRPQKSARGQRIYSRRDVDTLLKVRELLYAHRFTIAGAKQKLREGGFEPAPAPAPAPPPVIEQPAAPACGVDDVRVLRDELVELRTFALGFLDELVGLTDMADGGALERAK